MTSGIGTPYYMAPEMLRSSKHYTAAVDTYSYGIMAAQVFAGKLEYDSGLEFDTPYGLSTTTTSLRLPPTVARVFSRLWLCATNSICDECVQRHAAEPRKVSRRLQGAHQEVLVREGSRETKFATIAPPPHNHSRTHFLFTRLLFWCGNQRSRSLSTR